MHSGRSILADVFWTAEGLFGKAHLRGLLRLAASDIRKVLSPANKARIPSHLHLSTPLLRPPQAGSISFLWADTPGIKKSSSATCHVIMDQLRFGVSNLFIFIDISVCHC
jgi:hypothetical protein